MNVAIDLGNTRAKVGLFKDQQLLKIVEDLQPEQLFSWLAVQEPSAAIIGSVNAPTAALQEQLSSLCSCMVLDANLPVPVQKQYQTPQTLGADRLAAVVGGMSRFPGQAVLVIDTGTCITYDYVDARAHYLGGGIAPGLKMRFKALHNFTARLPLIDNVPSDAPLLGQSTKESIQSGVVNGSCAEIEGMIARYETELGPMRIIICGGDAKFFETKIKRPIFVIPELVLIGLNEILRYNVPNY